MNKRYLFVALGAAGAVGLMYFRNKVDGKKRDEREKSSTSRSTRSPSGTSESTEKTAEDKKAHDDLPGAQRELREFLAGESWFDEMGWHSVWDRAGVDAPDVWLKKEGVEMLTAERQKLTEHPALLAGCRRRWIVVCRYAGIDVADAAQFWNDTDK